MNQLPEIGERVKYHEGKKSCSGVVVAVYPGGYRVPDDNGGFYIQPDFVSIKVDEKPEWWNWAGDRFAPSAEFIEYAK